MGATGEISMSVLSEEEEHEVSQYEDLRSCANRAMWTIDLQVCRLRNFDASLTDFVLQTVSDAELLLLMADRLLAVSRHIDRMTGGALKTAANEFEGNAPNLRQARNVVAHIDEYLQGDGKNKSIRVGSLSTHSLDVDRFSFAGLEFDFTKLLTSAQKLFTEIQSNPPTSFKKALAARE
jgi:hypothetical protein